MIVKSLDVYRKIEDELNEKLEEFGDAQDVDDVMWEFERELSNEVISMLSDLSEP